MSETMKIKKMLDYLPGDLVQLVGPNFHGAIGRIISIKPSHKGSRLLYEVEFINSEGDTLIRSVVPDQMRFLSHAEE